MSSAQERAAEVIARVLGSHVKVNGGELESVLTIYKPEGLAILCRNNLVLAGLLVDDDTARLVALGPVGSRRREMDATCADGVIPKWVLARMQDIYRQAGIGTPPETQDRPLSARLPVGNPSDGPVVPPEPSEGDTAPVSGGAG